MAPENIGYILDTTWLWTAVVYIPLGASCSVLGYLERPLIEQVGSERKRQICVCSALLLESAALLIRGMWSISKIGYSLLHPDTVTGYVVQGAFSRLSESLQYASCLVMAWQWGVLCASILGWNKSKLRRFGRVLLGLGVVFTGYYMGTTGISYDPSGSKAELLHDRYDDVIVSCKSRSCRRGRGRTAAHVKCQCTSLTCGSPTCLSGFFVVSALMLLFFAQTITASIHRWSSINASASGGESSNPRIRSAGRHSRRLYRASIVLVASFLVRAGSWSVSVITQREKGPYPWFYPICFYQIPVTLIAVTIMCIAGNADRRLCAAAGWFCPAVFGEGGCDAGCKDLCLACCARHWCGSWEPAGSNPSRRASVSPASRTLRVSYVAQEQEPTVELEATYSRTARITPSDAVQV